MDGKNMPRKRGAEIRKFILDNISSHPKDITSFTAEQFNITRQAVLRHIHILDEERLIHIEGKTNDRIYSLAPIAEERFQIPINNDLAEDKVWREYVRPLLEGVQTNVLEICEYGISEMVNNVRDHSQGDELDITISYKPDQIMFIVRDDGIGIFRKIQNELGLDDPLHVILELAKGKLTTDPQRHSGEGIFFTSRMFDNFGIASGNVLFLHTESSGDWAEQIVDILIDGTLIRMIIDPLSIRTRREIYSMYESEEDMSFSKTKVPVRLIRYGDENLISRSQAKRLLARFDRFQEVYLDFLGVEEIGQSFADEIFRVYQTAHPDINLVPYRANDNVINMINRAKMNGNTLLVDDH